MRMHGFRAVCLALLIVVGFVPGSGASHLGEVPFCDAVTVDAVGVDEYYVYEDEAGDAQVWEEENGLEGLQVADCKVVIDEEEDEFETYDADVHHVTGPAGAVSEVVGLVEDAVDELREFLANFFPFCIPGTTTCIHV